MQQEHDERANFVRSTRLLLEVALPLLRTHFRLFASNWFRQAWVDGNSHFGAQLWQSLPPKTKSVVDFQQSKIKSAQVDKWDITILKAVLCYGPVSHEFRRAMGNNLNVVLKPIVDCHNTLFAHAATMFLPALDLDQVKTKLVGCLANLSDKLPPDSRPFDLTRELSNILAGVAFICCTLVSSLFFVSCLFSVSSPSFSFPIRLLVLFILRRLFLLRSTPWPGHHRAAPHRRARRGTTNADTHTHTNTNTNTQH